MLSNFIPFSAKHPFDTLINLGWMHENGLGFKKDVRYAVDLYKDAAKLCCSTAMVNLGNVYERGVLTGQPDYDSAFMWYELAAKYGNLKGKFNHANCFHWGWGTKVDHDKAFKLFSELFELGYDGVEFYMGLYYQEGLAVEQDYGQAHHYYLIGAEKDDMYCCNQLGVLYAKGLGVEKNPQKALEYYKKAAELGDDLAYTNVGWMYESGDLGEADMDAAAIWYARGSEAGKKHTRPQPLASEMLFYGDVIDTNAGGKTKGEGNQDG
jgi:hypothetical protein